MTTDKEDSNDLTADAGADFTTLSKPDAETFRIAVLGDRTGHPDDDAFRSVLREMRRLGPDAIVGVGDFIDGYQPDSRQAETEAEWDSVLGMIDRFLPDVPLYSAAGNHDVWSAASEAIFSARLHPPNHVVTFGSTAIIFFDTSRVNAEAELTDEALDWLVSALHATRDKVARVVVTHKPLFALPGGGEYGAPLHDVLIAGNATLVICGHWHHAMADDRDGIQYRMIGTSGARPNRPGHPESGNMTQFAWLVATQEGIRFSLIQGGAVSDSDRFPYEVNQLEWRIRSKAVVPVNFTVNPTDLPDSGVLTLDIANVTEVPIAPRIAFEGNDWRVKPAAFEARLSPQARLRKRLRYQRSPDDPVFPGPAVSAAFPFFDATYRLETHLTPTLSLPVKSSAFSWTVDGVITSDELRGAVPIGPFFETRGMGGPPVASVSVAIQDDTLYAAVRIEDNEKEPPVAPDPTDTYFEDGDHVLLLVDANTETSEYARFSVDRFGRLDQRRARAAMPRKPVEVKTATAQDETGWTVEIAIPLGELEPALGVRAIGFNAVVGREGAGGLSKAYWQPLGDHNEEALGRLTF